MPLVRHEAQYSNVMNAIFSNHSGIKLMNMTYVRESLCFENVLGDRVKIHKVPTNSPLP